MEYTKDIILNVNYGQTGSKAKLGFIKKIGKKLAKNKMITTIIVITFMLMILDFMLVSSFVKILNNM